MKRLTAATLLICVLGLTSCTPKNNDFYNDFIHGKQDTSINDSEKGSDDKSAYSPKKSEDEVLVYPMSDFEIIDTFDGSQYSIFKVPQADGNGLYGVIDIYGNTCMKAEYESLGWCGWHEVLWGSNGWPDTTNYPVYIDENYRLDNLCAHGGGITWGYVLDCKTNAMYCLSSGEGSISIDKKDAIPAYTPYVKYTGENPIEFDENYYYNLQTDLTEEDYEYYGDRAYANYDYFIGSMPLSEFECEFRNSRNEVISLGKCSIWYSQFTNDYLKIIRNGKCGFVDKNGKDASQFVYENAEEAYDGKAWVKKDGKWVVIKLS